MDLNLRQRATWAAHLFKAVAYQYHRPLRQRLGRLIPHDGVIVDVGAHAGQHVKLFAAMVPEGRVLAFEPGTYANSILRRVAKWLCLKNVELIEMGLSDRASTERLYVPLKRRGSLGFGLSHLAAGTDGRETLAEEIQLTTLDDFIESRGLGRVDFLKVDIEGWEANFLRGAQRTIAKYRPSILIEVNPKALERAGARPEEVFSLLSGGDYACFKTFEHDDYAMLPVDGYEGNADYLFVPRGSENLVS